MAQIRPNPIQTSSIRTLPRVNAGEQRILLIGSLGKDATAVVDQVIDADGINYRKQFGANSWLAESIADIYDIDQRTEVCVLPTNITTTDQSKYTFTFTNSATKSFSLRVYWTRLKYLVEVPIESGANANSITEALKTALDDIKENTVVDTVEVQSNVLTGTCGVNGSFGENLYFKVEIPDDVGVTCSIAKTTSINTTTAVIDPESLGDKYDFTVPQPGLNIHNVGGIVTKFTDYFWSHEDSIKDSLIIQAYYGDDSATDFVGIIRNSPIWVGIIQKNVPTRNTEIGNVQRTVPGLEIVRFVAIRSRAMIDGENLSQYFQTDTISDLSGGLHNASLPFFNTIVSREEFPKKEDYFTTERQKLWAESGGSFIGSNSNSSASISGQLRTTYKTNPITQVADNTFQYANITYTTSKVRQYIINAIENAYRQKRLDDGTVVRDGIATPKDFRSTLISAYNFLVQNRLIPQGISQTTGINYEKAFKDSIDIKVSMAQGSVAISMEVVIIAQLRKIDVNFVIGNA